MGNLFLREKENWWAWVIWGLIGALLTFYGATLAKPVYLIPICGFGVIALLTWWIHQSRRFDFLRAFKVTIFVFLVSVLPAFLLILLPRYKGTELTLQAALFFIIGMLVCVICAWIAKRPRQYY